MTYKMSNERHNITLTMRLRSILSHVASLLGRTAMNIVTLPYYRSFRLNTLQPILTIADSARIRNNDAEVAELLSSWKDRKQNELYSVLMAATLLSAAVVGCCSWEARQGEHWIVPAAWHSSLVLSFFAILLSGSESFVFASLAYKTRPFVFERDLSIICHVVRNSGSLQSENALVHTPGSISSISSISSSSGGWVDRDLEEGRKQLPRSRTSYFPDMDAVDEDVEIRIRWNMVFTWQAPIMLFVYAAIAFIVGLTAYVCVPLYSEGPYRREPAIVFLADLGMGGICFIWCSFWEFKFMGLDDL
ncbi:uncharacterized protein F4812DRAFT_471003 [Daldinia caldariorum]|uniref:uncharacterized protein n=1 Tax=Daldinia caldariorum TaxID=326644 RepID=UPI0020086379|nr:uncharacterized protein F4812DRAFT_471003 [Daldinia caldariorum]KAI1468414.1 hypothetical protein F4812DRAFT_471003 [Daldinia caldariorum]